MRKLKEKFQHLPPLAQQRLAFGGLLGLSVCGLGVLWVSTSAPEPIQKAPQVTFQGASQALPMEEIWTHKVSSQVEKATAQMNQVTAENTLLKKRLEALEEAMGALGTAQEEMKAEAASAPPSPVFPPQPSSEDGTAGLTGGGFPSPEQQNQTFSETPSVGSQLGRLQRVHGLKDTLGASKQEEASPASPPFHIVENTVPAGSHFRTVLTSAVAASTATNASSDPRPVTLRFLDDGRLPRGWSSCLKDAVLLGHCYGDLSSERVLCRLHTLSWVEPNGEVVEREVEGWVVGEDGLFGIRGHVVDRAGEAARSSMIAGVLSGFSGFFQAERMSSVFPVSPFGQTAALKGSDMLASAGASGVGKALEKLSDFYVKRAESMSPVLMVNAGRVVDVIFKKGFDVAGSSFRKNLAGRAQRLRKDHVISGTEGRGGRGS